MAEILLIKTDKKLNKTQTDFNNIINRIEKKKKELDILKKNVTIYKQQKLTILGEVVKKNVDAVLGYVDLILDLYKDNYFKKDDKEKLILLGSNLLNGLDKSFDYKHDEITKKHDDFATIHTSFLDPHDKEMQKELLQMMLKQQGINIKFDEEEGVDFETIQKKMEEQMKNMQEEFEAKKNFKRKNKYNETLSASAIIAGENQKKSWKKIYLELIKKLHPDTEIDEELKLEKNEAVKQVTAAYENNNFYTLLQLQMQYGETGNEFAKFDDTMLKQYIKILKIQDAELKEELYSLTLDIDENIKGFNKPNFETILTPQLQKEVARINRLNKDMQTELTKCKNKSYMKEILNHIELDDMMGDSLFDDLNFNFN